MPQINIHTILVALRCWWHIALPLGLLLAAGAAVVVYYATKPTYTAQNWIRIYQRPMQILQGTGGDDPQRFVANQIQLLTSPPVLEPVIGLRAVMSTPELRREVDPLGYLRKNLRVKPQGNSDFFVIEFTSEDPAKAALIVNEVANSYIALFQKHDAKVSQDMIKELDSQSKQQYGEVERLRGVVNSLTKQVAGETPGSGMSKRDSNRATTIQDQLEAQLLNAEIEFMTTQAELNAEQKLLLKEDFTPPAELVERRLLADQELNALKATLQADQEKAEGHKKASKNLATNTVYQQLAKKITAAETSLAKLTEERRKLYAGEIENAGRSKRQAQIETLQAQLVKMNEMITFLKDRLKTESGELKQHAGKELDLEFAKNDEERATLFYNALVSRIQLLQSERKAPERVEGFRSATEPTRPDEEIPYKKMLMAAFAALAIPFGLAVGIEMLFGRVASRQQLEHTGKIAVVGEITNLPRRRRSQAADGTQRKDVQLFEESINGLRTYLSLIGAARGRHVLAVTSAISREGKTSLAAQLAISVANATGKPTLLIDGDMRSPDIHRIFGVELGPGLAEVLANRVPLEEAIETEFCSNLHLLTAGRLGSSPHSLTGSGAFEAVIEKLRGMYDNIIVDTPPILPASESLLMAGAADAAVLCVRRDYSRVDQVSEAAKRLSSAGARVAGAVLNGVPMHHYAYRYGSYYYSSERRGASDDVVDSNTNDPSEKS